MSSRAWKDGDQGPQRQKGFCAVPGALPPHPAPQGSLNRRVLPLLNNPSGTAAIAGMCKPTLKSVCIRDRRAINAPHDCCLCIATACTALQAKSLLYVSADDNVSSGNMALHCAHRQRQRMLRHHTEMHRYSGSIEQVLQHGMAMFLQAPSIPLSPSVWVC